MSSRRGAAWRFAGLLLFIAACIAALRLTPLGEWLRPANVRSVLEQAGPWAPLAYVTAYMVIPVFALPGSPLSLAGGYLFGGLWGTVYTVAGAGTGAALAFLVARHLGRDFVDRVVSGKVRTLDEGVGENGFRVIFFLRLVPLVPFNLLNFAAGLSSVRLRDYTLATYLGIVPGTFAYVYLGSSLAAIGSWHFFAALGLLLLLMTVPLAYRRWKKGREATMSDDRKKDLSDLSELLPDDWEGSEEQEAHQERERRRRLPRLNLRLEKKGRRGKTVTVVFGFEAEEDQLETYASELKSRCGTGGTVREGTIELQGDHRRRAGAYFQDEGYEVTGIPGD